MRAQLATALAVAACLGLLLSGCAGQVPQEQDPEVQVTAAELQRYLREGEVRDDRGRFREVLCKVLDAHGPGLPDYRPCDAALRDTGPEQGGTGAPVPLGATEQDYLVLLVPGLGWNCFEQWLDLSGSAPAHVASFGYEVRLVPVDGLASTTSNARMIRDYVAALPDADAARPLILMGYSKGVPDILEALVSYPGLAQRVAAVVSLAGAVHGSPLAADATQAQANMLTLVPGSACDKADGDNAAVASLHPDVRNQWLEDNALPDGPRYYSIVTFPRPERVSWILRNSYLLLGQTDRRNDTQLILSDQLIPGSTVIALVNADHWAVAVPVTRGHPLLGKSLVDQNDYPREAFLEALLRYLEADLAK